MRASEIRFQQVHVPDGVIDLGLGQPQNELLPLQHLRRAASSFDRLDILQYGADWGDGWYRVALAEYLTAQYGVPVDAEHLFATNGNSQALDMVCTVFATSGDIVFVEDPTYFIALDTFRDHGLDVRPVPVDADGLDTSVLEALLVDLRTEGRRPAFVHTVPAFQNPTGVTLSTTRRRHLVDLSREFGFVVVADEVYHLLRFTDAAPPPPMSAFTDEGTVMSLGTFSKIFAPGLRLGWVHGHPSLLERLGEFGVIRSGGGLNPITGLVATTLMRDGGLDAHRHWLEGVYRERIAMVDDELRAVLPDDVGWSMPTGGYFFWLQLPDRYDVLEVRRRAQAQGVDLRPGPLFSPVGARHNCVRLSFTFYRDAELVEGVRRLGRAMA